MHAGMTENLLHGSSRLHGYSNRERHMNRWTLAQLATPRRRYEASSPADIPCFVPEVSLLHAFHSS